ncbi:unnamed protein product [Effrenium voratum]|nr:unnamed protein product [Effrenium voratum]
MPCEPCDGNVSEEEAIAAKKQQVEFPLSRPRWQQDAVASQCQLGPATCDLQELVASMRQATSSQTALFYVNGLHSALAAGGHDASEKAFAAGGVEASVELLNSCCEDVLARTMETLWLLVDDIDSCQQLMKLNGHQRLCQIAQRHSPSHPHVARAAFVLLAETLYSESRSSVIWDDGLDGHFLADALRWSMESPGATSLGFVCDVTALWLQRTRSSEAVKALIDTIPLLLKTMSASQSDAMVLQHGYRLLWAFAHQSRTWPEAVRQPVLAALQQLLRKQEPSAMLSHYNAMALKAVSDLADVPARATKATLDELD